MSSVPPQPLKDRRGRVYTPAIGSRLRPWLWIILVGFALMAANGAYLVSVRVLGLTTGREAESFFSLLMIALHLVLGVLLLAPFIVFGVAHWVTARKRPNKAAIRFGLMLLAAAVVMMLSGFGLWREFLDVRDPNIRQAIYWAHVLTPVAAIVLYMQHRFAGPRIKWHYVRAWVGAVGLFIAVMAVLHNYDPRATRRSNDPRYTYPSEVKLAGGKLLDENVMMLDEYCLKCHKDAYEGWFHSAHHFSSFNNKAYLAAVRETREVALKRDGNMRAARWCAGCHDLVPFFSGAFDDPNYDDVNTRSSQAGITCVSCHAITHVNSTRGNADYTIEEPQLYPFTRSDNPILQWINNTLVKAKPEMHKRTFLKPDVHRSAEFCSTCHKVNLPFALNHYKDFLRGQNHWDNFVLSGVGGGNAKSFYYPPKAEKDCNGCHMPALASRDFGAFDFDPKVPGREIHDHLFLGANTGLASLRARPDIAAKHEAFLKDKQLRIDIFGLREGGEIDGPLVAPLRPEIPTLRPGNRYLVETVVRTLRLGHVFPQGTADSNEIWVELIARADGQVIGRSGGLDAASQVDPYAHFINIYMLDRKGNRIDRRNPQDIFVPLYNKQIPPGAGQVVHFALEVPEGLTGPVTLEAKLNYRKFDRTFMDYVFGKGQGPALPVVVVASDSVQLPVSKGAAAVNRPSPIPAEMEWQRWNDYGIGLLLEGNRGATKGELKQAEAAFRRVAEQYGKPDGWVNLARVYLKEGRNDDALAALAKATEKKFAAPWAINWLAAQVDERNGNLDEAIKKLRDVLATRDPSKNYDFGRDYEVRNALGRVLWGRYHQTDPDDPARLARLDETIDAYRGVLRADTENIDAHYGLSLAYAELARAAAAGGEAPPPARPAAGVDSEPPTPEALVAAAEALAKPGAAGRVDAARDLASAIVRFVRGPRPEFGSRPNTLIAVANVLAEPCRTETDPAARSALAATLATAHSNVHSLVRPDETAEGIAQRLARQANPAANFNANSVVIHDLHRPGAPGIGVDAAPAPVTGAAPGVPAAPVPVPPPSSATTASVSSPNQEIAR